MKSSYTLFSRHPFLNAIALFFLAIAVIMIAWAFAIFLRYRSSYTETELLVFVLSLLVVMLMNIWLLSSSILPIVKIHSEGITAYSIFWKRRIAWDVLHTARLLKVKNGFSKYGTSVKFEYASFPEKKRIAVLNHGYAVNTFIVVFNKSWQKPQDRVLQRGLYNHRMIAGGHAIAFEYSQRSWDIIMKEQLK